VETGDGRKPLIVGRGLLLLADFCRSTGLGPATVEAPIREGEIEGAVAVDDRVAGVFEDASRLQNNSKSSD
jgi:hypothetical protein